MICAAIVSASPALPISLVEVVVAPDTAADHRTHLADRARAAGLAIEHRIGARAIAVARALAELDADAAADPDAGRGALDPNETRPVFGAWTRRLRRCRARRGRLALGRATAGDGLAERLRAGQCRQREDGKDDRERRFHRHPDAKKGDGSEA